MLTWDQIAHALGAALGVEPRIVHVTSDAIAAADPDWGAGLLGDKAHSMVFDTTKYLPNEPHDGKAKYAEAHVPGADYFDIDLIADPEAALPHMIPSAARFEKLMGLLGVSNASRVVFYDQKGLASAARGWRRHLLSNGRRGVPVWTGR